MQIMKNFLSNLQKIKNIQINKDSLLSLKDSVIFRFKERDIAKQNSFFILILIVYLASLSVDLTEILISKNNFSPIVLEQTVKENTAKIQNDYTNLKTQEIFGIAALNDLKNIPTTSLSLGLKAIVASTVAKNSAAVIEYQGNQVTYFTGDTIENTSVVIKDILPNKIVINNQGKMESLFLVDELKNHKKVITDQKTNKLTSAIEEIKSANKDDIQEKLTDYINIAPVRGENGLEGFRITPGKDPKLFADMGLKANDLVTKLNGNDLTNIKEALGLLEELDDLEEVSLTVKRDEELHDILFKLPE